MTSSLREGFMTSRGYQENKVGSGTKGQ